jgi:hypothetical protein
LELPYIIQTPQKFYGKLLYNIQTVQDFSGAFPYIIRFLFFFALELPYIIRKRQNISGKLPYKLIASYFFSVEERYVQHIHPWMIFEDSYMIQIYTGNAVGKGYDISFAPVISGMCLLLIIRLAGFYG